MNNWMPFVSDSQETSIMAANTYKALVSGERTNVENAFVNVWGGDADNKARTVPALQYVRYGMHPVFLIGDGVAPVQTVTPASAISGIELPVFFGLPFKSISGVTSLPMAVFGRNVIELGTIGGNRQFKLSCVHHDRAAKKRTMLSDLVFELVQAKLTGEFDAVPLLRILDSAERKAAGRHE